MFNMMIVVTPWKFKIAPENLPSQKETNIPTIIVQGQNVNFGGVQIFHSLAAVERQAVATGDEPIGLDG